MFRELEHIEDNPFSRYVEYLENDKVLGRMKYSIIYDRMELDDIEVLKEYRNKGIGNKLMSYLVSVAIKERVVNITLEVRISNEIARNMYKKFGFREVALRKFYYGNEDGSLMEKQVMENERYILFSYRIIM